MIGKKELNKIEREERERRKFNKILALKRMIVFERKGESQNRVNVDTADVTYERGGRDER